MEHRNGLFDAEHESYLATVVEWSARAMAKGRSYKAVVESLVYAGYAPDVAEALATRGRELKKAAFREEGEVAMKVGLIWLVGGVGVTALSAALAELGLPFILIAWGAIVWGALTVLRGFSRWVSG